MAMHKGIIGQSEGGASVKSFDRMPAVHMPVNVPQSDKTLGDYVQRTLRAEAFETVAKEKKLNFEQWYPLNKNKIGFDYNSAFIVWNAAQENM